MAIRSGFNACFMVELRLQSPNRRALATLRVQAIRALPALREIHGDVPR